MSTDACLYGHEGPLHNKSMLCETCYKKYQQEWETPPDLWDVLNREFGFDIDVCASRVNKKCASYISKKEDGIKTQWFIGTRVSSHSAWCNPGFRSMRPWLKKAYLEAQCAGTVAVVVGLTDPSTEWWAFAEDYAHEIRDLSPRPQFIPAPGINKSSNSRSNSIFIFRRLPRLWRGAHRWTYRWKDELTQPEGARGTQELGSRVGV